MEEIQKNSSTEKNDTNEKRSKKLNPFVKNLFISVVIVSITVIFVLVCVISRPDNKTDKNYIFGIDEISELTTLECRYHTISLRDVEGGLLGKGKQYVWLEYDVVVKVGIDTKKMRIEQPTKDGVVRIYLPPAEIFAVSRDESTISRPVYDIGPFTNYSPKDEMQILEEGTNKLRSDVVTTGILDQAYDSAKQVIERYLKNISEVSGCNYTVEWINATEDEQTELITENNEE